MLTSGFLRRRLHGDKLRRPKLHLPHAGQQLLHGIDVCQPPLATSWRFQHQGVELSRRFGGTWVSPSYPLRQPRHRCRCPDRQQRLATSIHRLVAGDRHRIALVHEMINGVGWEERVFAGDHDPVSPRVVAVRRKEAGGRSGCISRLLRWRFVAQDLHSRLFGRVPIFTGFVRFSREQTIQILVRLRLGRQRDVYRLRLREDGAEEL
ncbi:hypothetical protein CCHR01_14556 [Colletotrichum chrysophilum]|uniref:Uncharacterized protein n=1 Tax=Colletotrichum chrysophilum TaxID=1836956 RepID=A0AAD9A799_9PEZI|nr:hypothetical protein CCHR01_14556 [Colletotrichum chrysophilum]